MNKKAFQDALGDSVERKRRILVVDGSRVVRATLAKRLGDSFDVVEEENGESAWQRLMLDGRIAVVISGIHPPRLAARDLLARLRASALRRLRETPFVLLVSDLETQAAASDGGDVAGFMTKSMSKEAMASCLENLLSGPGRQGMPQAAHGTGDERPAVSATLPEQLLGAEAFASAVASLPSPQDSKESLCMLVFGIDHLETLTARFGADVPELLSARIAKLLTSKIRPGDQLGRYGKDRLAIVSHGVDQRLGMRFGKRVCKSLATGQIAIHGQRIRLTVSVGVAATSDDRVASAGELLALAGLRLEQALACGGNTACAEHRPDCPMHRRDKGVVTLLHVLGGGEPAAELKDILSLEVLPVLRTLDEKLALGLPLAEVERRLALRSVMAGAS